MADKIEIEQHETLAEALLYAQSEYPPLEKGSTVKVDTKSGGSYSYTYADLAYTKKVTDPYLWKHGLVVKDRTEIREGKEILITTLTHVTSKESESSELDVTDTSDMKGLGGNITYARRYNYWNLTGRIGEDDSENRPLPRKRQPSRPQGKTQQPPETPSKDKADNAGGNAPEQQQVALAAIRECEIYLSGKGYKPMDLRKESLGTTALGNAGLEEMQKYVKNLQALCDVEKISKDVDDDTTGAEKG